MRISENSILQDFLKNLHNSRQRWFEWSQQVSSGKRIQEPSDEPADSARIIRIRDEFSRSNQYLRNIGRAESKLGVTSSALNSIRNLINNISEKTIFALNGVTSQESRNSIALELRGILENLKHISATNVDGNYIFSGSQVGTPPLVEVDGTFTYQGDDRAVQVEVAQNESVQVNVLGSDVFLDPSTDLMNTLRALIEHLEAGDVASATTALGRLQEAGKVVDQARFQISKSINQVENANSRIDDRLLDLTKEVSRLEDADMAEAISRMVQAETALQASLGAGARMRQGNLFDYLG